jgi:tRNA-intron endonuclease, archaea type
VSGAAAADGSVRVSDPSESGAVYGRGFFGEVTPAGLTLERVEGTYLVEMGRLDVASEAGRRLGWKEMFRRGLRSERGFGIRYLVYRDLRQRGYVVRVGPPPVAFSVLPRGGILHKTPSRFWVEALSERSPFHLEEVLARAASARAARKTLLLGVVDEESDLTYYRVRFVAPHGALPALSASPTADGSLADDRVLVHDEPSVDRLGKSYAFGSRIGGRLELSLIEAAYLMESGTLRIRSGRTGRVVTADALLRRVRRLEPGFDDRLGVYRALRQRRLVVKTGFKYGAHFRAYPRDPAHVHARYLVQAVPADFTGPWPEIAGAVRLAQGVRKEFLLGIPGDAPEAQFVALERVRP